MISEKEFKNYQDKFNFEELPTIKEEIILEKIYEILEIEKVYDVFPTYDLQDTSLEEDIFEVYKILFWGFSALASTLLWLYFFLT